MNKIAWVFRSKERNEFSIETLFACLKKYIGNSEVQEYYLPHGRYNRVKFFRDDCEFAKKIKADIYHITGEVYFVTPFFPKNKVILTVHDCIDLETMRGLKKAVRWLFWYYIPFRHCKYIACISHKVCQEIEQRFPFTKGKVVYAPNPIDDSYTRVEKFFPDEPRILIVGTRTNKNVERIIESVKGINCSLFIIGVLEEQQKMLLAQYHIKYQNVYHISNEQVRQAYCDCDLLCFPSTYEGFGRPIIEANAIGRPVITSNLQPMVEVGSDAALYVNPYDVEDIRNGILKLIYDKELRNKLVENGYKNAEKYSAKHIADIYMELYYSGERK